MRIPVGMYGVALLALGGCLTEPKVTVCANGDCADGSAADAARDAQVDVGRFTDGGDASVGEAGTMDVGRMDGARDVAVVDARPDVVADSAPDVVPDMAPPCVPVLERCNQIDDDCDGQIDEDGFDVRRQLGGRLTVDGHLNTRVAISGDTLLAVWSNRGQRPVNFFGRIFNLADGSMSAIRQYTQYTLEDTGLRDGYDVAPHGEGFMTARVVHVPGVVRPATETIELLNVDLAGNEESFDIGHDSSSRVRAIRLIPEGEVRWIVYSNDQGLFSLRLQAGFNPFQNALSEVRTGNFEMVRHDVNGLRRSFVAWSTTSEEGEPGIHLAVIDPDGSVASNARRVVGNVAEPSIFSVGQDIGLTWVALNRGTYSVLFDLLDPASTQSRLEAPVVVYSVPDRILARPQGVARAPVDERHPTVVIDWLAAPKRDSPDFGQLGQHTMRTLLNEGDGVGWRVSAAEVQRASASNLIDIGLARAGATLVSLATDNGYGGAMCHALCTTPLVVGCEGPPRDPEVLDCRSNCRWTDLLEEPAMARCLSEVDCDDPDFPETADECEDSRPEPDFDTGGIYLDLTTFCQPMASP